MTVAASGSRSNGSRSLQFSLGEGPCFEAYRTRRPVLIPDLAAVAPTRWPGYAMAAHDHGVRAVFALPLQVGAAASASWTSSGTRRAAWPSRRSGERSRSPR